MPHSYEEIRDVALDLLAGRDKASFPLDQYENFKISVATVLGRRAGRADVANQAVLLDHQDRQLFQEMFWDLFRQGIITLGLDDDNRAFPFFRVSTFGRTLVKHQRPYFFHDVTSYAAVIRENLPEIHPTTLLYLQEAMQAFQSGCLLSATVMIGVATEHVFQLLLDTIESNTAHRIRYQAVFEQKTILPRINKFRNILEQDQKALTPEIKEDLDTHFAGILSVIRNFRNEAGHPSGKIISREQVYVLLHLFIPYGRKLYQIRRFFQAG